MDPFTGALIAGGVGTIGSIYGAGQAANAQRDAANQSADLQWRMYQQQRADQAPWREAGIAGLNGITNNLGDYTRNFTMSDFTNDPGYAFRMQEGQKALERSAAAKGGLFGGRTMKELTRFGQDYGAQEYQNAYNRFNNDRTTTFNRLSTLANLGQTANGQLSGAGMNYANQAGQAYQNAGDARAGQYLGTAGAINQGIGTGLGTWMGMTRLNQQQSLLDQLSNGGNVSPATLTNGQRIGP